MDSYGLALAKQQAHELRLERKSATNPESRRILYRQIVALNRRIRDLKRAAGMTLELGKSYVTRSGEIVKITSRKEHRWFGHFLKGDGGYCYWDEQGLWSDSGESGYDLVAEERDNEDASAIL